MQAVEYADDDDYQKRRSLILKIQLIRIHKDGRQMPIRIFSHSEEIIIQRTRVKVMDRNTDKVNAVYILEGLGPTGWMTIETTGNQELFAYIYVGDEVTNHDKS